MIRGGFGPGVLLGIGGIGLARHQSTQRAATSRLFRCGRSQRVAPPKHMLLGMTAGDAYRGHLDLLLLAAVGEKPAHGYAIIEELRRRSGGSISVPEGTLYPTLHRLERQGWIESRWADGTTRRRRVYQITRGGRRAL